MITKSNLTAGVALAAAALCPALSAQETGTKKPTVRAARLVGGKADTKTQGELEAQRAKKLAKPVFKLANWVMDYDEARTRAKAEGKLILTYFTRSFAP